VLQSFIDRGLWDEAWEEVAPTQLAASGVKAPHIEGIVPSEEALAGHMFKHYEQPLSLTPLLAHP
jgi:hypothetical protein